MNSDAESHKQQHCKTDGTVAGSPFRSDADAHCNPALQQRFQRIFQGRIIVIRIAVIDHEPVHEQNPEHAERFQRCNSGRRQVHEVARQHQCSRTSHLLLLKQPLQNAVE